MRIVRREPTRGPTGVMHKIPSIVLLEIKLQGAADRAEVSADVSRILDAAAVARELIRRTRQAEKSGKVNWRETHANAANAYGLARTIAQELYVAKKRRIYLGFITENAAKEFEHYELAATTKPDSEPSGAAITQKQIIDGGIRAAKHCMEFTIIQGDDYFTLAERFPVGTKERTEVLEESAKAYMRSLGIRESLIETITKTDAKRRAACARILTEALEKVERVCEIYQMIDQPAKALSHALDAAVGHEEINELLDTAMDKIDNYKKAIRYQRIGLDVLVRVVKPTAKEGLELDSTETTEMKVRARISQYHELTADQYIKMAAVSDTGVAHKHLGEALKHTMLALRETAAIKGIERSKRQELAGKIVSIHEQRADLFLRSGLAVNAIEALHAAAEIDSNQRLAEVAEKIADGYGNLSKTDTDQRLAFLWGLVCAREYARRGMVNEARKSLNRAKCMKVRLAPKVEKVITRALSDDTYLVDGFVKSIGVDHKTLKPTK